MPHRHSFFIALLIALIAGAAQADEALRPERLSGPPAVSCRAWAIADGDTGEVLWGSNIDQGRMAASTTKIMCAVVVLELAEKNPSVLDESLTFSRLADRTYGSSSDVNAYESLPIRECLYGLLLPSGNDMGNALAEHFNERLDPPDYDDDVVAPSTGDDYDTRENFIAEMNRMAQRLGMTKTFYRNTYGDKAGVDEPTTTAHDLIRLAYYAMQNPLFREVVSTRNHLGKVQIPGGGTRTIRWHNTNRLLDFEGYDGVKTGSTGRAGRCLVSRGNRGDDQLLVVVLGSTSNDSRYIDSRNLYRWAWTQRGHMGDAATTAQTTSSTNGRHAGG